MVDQSIWAAGSTEVVYIWLEADVEARLQSRNVVEYDRRGAEGVHSVSPW